MAASIKKGFEYEMVSSETLEEVASFKYKDAPMTTLLSQFDCDGTNSTILADILELYESDREFSREAVGKILNEYKKSIITFLIDRFVEDNYGITHKALAEKECLPWD